MAISRKTMNLQEKIAELQKKYEEVESINQELSSRLTELFVLYNLTRILSTTFDIHQIIQNIFRLFREALPVQYSSLYLVQSVAETLELHEIPGTAKDQDSIRLLPSADVLQEILVNKNVRMKLIRSAEELQLSDGQQVELPLQYAGFPIVASQKKAIGVLNFFRKADEPFSRDELNFFSRVAEELGNILDKTILFLQTREDTFRDHLTGAYNRRYFNDRLKIEIKRAERYKRNLSLLMIDIDDFKVLNDEFGHTQGDEILRKLVKVIQKNLRQSDVLCRYGGEEFVVLLPETNAASAKVVGEKLRKAVEKELAIQAIGVKRPVTISVGVANFPADAYSAESLVQTADRRLYLAKRKGKNCTVAEDEEPPNTQNNRRNH